MIEYGTDTTRVIANLTFAGTAARFSGITWIFSHAGGVMPYLIEAVKAKATLGEICMALKEVFGTYREPVVL
jgi:methylmalonyl-CoA mutase N-terminal domain/subunit